MDKGRAVVDTVMNLHFQRNAAHILCILGSVGFSSTLCGNGVGLLHLEDGTDRLSRNVGK